MGVYSEYLDRQMSFETIVKERKEQLKKISAIRKRDILVYASNFNKGNAPTGIDISDILPFQDQLSNIKSENIDIIIETPGGLAEVVEDFVNLIRAKHKKVGIIIPGTAKSAGTIFAMAADEILMGDMSALGPIDAQILSNGKRFSAEAFIQGLEKIKKDSNENKRIELAYIPMLQHLSPGEIQNCENAQQFSQKLVKDWLVKYKFSTWEKHKNGSEVKLEEKEKRAEEIAEKLAKHSDWLTHSRSIYIKDLEDMKLKITDYTKNIELNDAIIRYYTLLHMTFETNIYKIYETISTQIYRSINETTLPFNNPIRNIPNLMPIKMTCPKCKNEMNVQLNFDKKYPLIDGMKKFPKNNKIICDKCNNMIDVLGLRQQLEAQFHKKLIIEY